MLAIRKKERKKEKKDPYVGRMDRVFYEYTTVGPKSLKVLLVVWNKIGLYLLHVTYLPWDLTKGSIQ